MEMQTEGIKAPQGFFGAGVKAGIKKSGKEDVAVIFSKTEADGAAVFTTNTMAAAPVIVSRRTMQNGKVRAIVVNSGCANACTGVQGQIDAQAMAHQTAGLLGFAQDEVLVASTGVIGEPLDASKFAHLLGDMNKDAVEDFWTEAALFSAAGCTTFVYGPGDIAQAHSADEWVGHGQLRAYAESVLRIVAGEHA